MTWTGVRSRGRSVLRPFAVVAVLGACDASTKEPRLVFEVTHSDPQTNERITALTLPNQLATVEREETGLVVRGLLPLRDRCDRPEARLLPDARGYVLRIRARDSPRHGTECGPRGEFLIMQYQARITDLPDGETSLGVVYAYPPRPGTPPLEIWRTREVAREEVRITRSDFAPAPP